MALVWQVTPLCRPEQADHVIREFAAQTHPDKRLCLVANGPARDLELQADLVLRSEPGKPAALNEALYALRGELIAIRDDDDISLPNDLAECVAAFEQTGAEIVGRLRHCVILDQVVWLFAEKLAEQWGTYAVWGGSLMFRVTPDVHEFPDELVTESQSWAKRMIAKGARVWRPSIANQIHVRKSRAGMWNAGAAEVRRTLSFGEPARRYSANGFIWIGPPSAESVRDEVFPSRRIAG